MGILQNDAQRAAQIVLFDLGDVDAFIPDLAICDIVEAVDQVGDGRFAGTGGADKSDLLARAAIEVDPVQNGLIRLLA